jgi:hypothetical protein
VAFTVSVIAILTGAMLSVRCNVVILAILTLGASIAFCVLGIVEAREIGFVLRAALIFVTSLQVGYLIGIVARALFAAANQRSEARSNAVLAGPHRSIGRHHVT